MNPPNPGDKKFGSNAARSIKEQEDSAAATPEQPANLHGPKVAEQVASKTIPGAKAGFAVKKVLNKKTSGPIAAVIGLLVTAFVFISGTFLPGLAIIKPAQDFVADLNSQLAAVDTVNGQLWSTKINKTARGCGAIKINCRFKTVDMKRATENFGRNGIKVEFDADPSHENGRAKIKSLEYTDRKGNNVLIDNPNDLQRAMRSNLDFRLAMIDSNNPKFLSFHDGPSKKALAKLKTSYSSKLRGNTPEEFDESLKRAVQTRGNISFANLRAEVDDNGNETGRYLNEDGEVFTKEEYDGLKESESRITNSDPTRNLIKNAARGVMITGAADTACMAYSMANAVEQAAKIYRSAELARYSQAVMLGMAGEIRAGDASPEKVEYISDKLSKPDLRDTVINEQALEDTDINGDPPMRINPDKGKTGLDSAFYKLSTNQEIPKINADNEQFLVAGGKTGMLARTMEQIRTMMGGASHQTIKNNCRVIQHPVTQGGALVIGVIVGAISFGTTTMVLMSASMLLGLATPYLTSMLGDMLAGRVTGPELEGTQMMDAAAIGADVMMNEQARARGLMALPEEEMVEYQNTNRQVELAYQEYETHKAADTPFDIYNTNSFIGSTLVAMMPSMMTAKQASLTSLAAIPQILGTAVKALGPKEAKAASMQIQPERYQQTNDTMYSPHGVAVNPSGVLVYGLPKSSMEMTPEQAAEWMVANDEIDPEDETGAPKDNDKKWNYKQYVENCVNGDIVDECLSKENYESNRHYAKFHLSVEWNKVLDGDIPGLKGGSDASLASGESGEVNPDGWAFPTTSDAILTSGFGPRGGAMHQGIDLAQPGDASGKPIFAARDGKVVASGPASGFGNWIVIEHEVDGRRFDTVYGHMYADGVYARLGDTVTAGQEIGAIGNAGQSSGAHLHFEIWDGGRFNGSAIDPAPIVGGGN